jgi:hypothetical protein
MKEKEGGTNLPIRAINRRRIWVRGIWCVVDYEMAVLWRREEESILVVREGEKERER